MNSSGSDHPHLSPASWLAVVLISLAVIASGVNYGGAPYELLLPLIGVLLLIGWINALRITFSPPKEIRFDLIDGVVVSFFVYLTLYHFLGPVEYLARVEWLNVLGMIILFWSGRYGISRRTPALIPLLALVLTSICICIFALWLKAHPETLVYGRKLHLHYAPRLTGTFGCPNHFGFFLVMATTVALSIGFFSKLSWGIRICAWYATALGLALILLTISRGSWIAMGIAGSVIILYAAITKRIKWWIPIVLYSVIIASLAIILLRFPDLTHRLSEGFETGTWIPSKKYCRIELIYDSINIFKDYPWFGTGPGTFVLIHPRYQSATFANLAVYNHNDYMNMLTDYGLVGLILALLFIGLCAKQLLRIPPSDAPWHSTVFRASGLAILAALAFHSVVDFNLHIPSNAFVFFLILGLGLRRTSSEEIKPNKRTLWIGRGMALVCVCTLAWGTYLAQKTARGYYPAWNAEKTTKKSLDTSSVKSIANMAIKGAKADPDSPYAAGIVGDVFRRAATRATSLDDKMHLGQISLEWYQIAEELNPLDDGILIRMALVLDVMKRYPEAFFQYQKCLKIQPYNGFYWTYYGSHLWRRGAHEKAKAAFEQALKSPFGHAQAPDLLAKLEVAIKHHKEMESLKPVESEGTPDITEDLDSATTIPKQTEPSLNIENYN